jgi:hypothetical protein
MDAVRAHKWPVRYRQSFTGMLQAHLIAIACSAIPKCHDH